MPLSPVPPPLPPPAPLDYRRVPPSPRQDQPLEMLRCLGAAVLLAATLTLICVWVARMCERLFIDFKVELPGATKSLLHFAGWFRHLGWAPIWLAAILLPMLTLLQSPPERPRRRISWLRWSIYLSLLLAALAALVLGMPIFSLIGRVT